MFLNSWKVIALSIMVVFTYGCGSTMKGESDYNAEVNFAQYESFAWVSPDPLISAPRNSNPDNIQRIKSEIVSVLTAKDYRQVEDTTAADFAVSFTVGTREEINIQQYPVMYGGAWADRDLYSGRYGTAMNYETYVEQYTEGTLAIDILDVGTDSPAWHGWATKKISGADRRDAAPLIKKAVNKILANFPP